MPLDIWPDMPEPLDPGVGSRADRLRMLQHARKTWNAVNTVRRDKVKAEVKAARQRQAEVAIYWSHHQAVVTERWRNRTGRTSVADIPEVAAQWHPGNPGVPENVAAMTQQRGTACPYRWVCPLGLRHASWAAWPKDRIQSGTGCPDCRKLAKVSDAPTLAAQYAGPVSCGELPLGSHDTVPWVCRTWALDSDTGQWYAVEHHFDAVIKDRSQQGHGCRVCAGYVIDNTNSLATWFPEIAEQLDDPSLDPRRLSTSTHNVSRKALLDDGPAGHYATYPWRCRHGHRWESTILNRVQGGGCPSCSTSGISKEQVQLVAELACLMELIEPGQADPRLPDGTPDFASHKIAIPPHLKPPHWRYKAVEVDARFRLSSHGVIVGLEYDGVYHHSSELRHRSQREAEKGMILKQAGALDVMVHVRVGDLPALQAPHVISIPVPERSGIHERACTIAAAVASRYPGSISAIAEYQAGGHERGQAQAAAFILAIWGQLRPPRPKTKRITPPKQRQLKATDPHRGSLLVPIGTPYRNPERRGETLRDYRCACGTRPVTAVQAQVTSGNTRSCGCLRDEAKRQSRPSIPQVETRAAREWARQHDIPLNGNGRLSGQVIASFRLANSSHAELIGPDGLLEEKHVREWAVATSRPMAARGRVPSSLWLDFADHILALQ